MGNTADVSIVICAYTEARWPDLLAALRSLERQNTQPREVIVVIDHNPRMLQRAREELTSVISLENEGPSGASGARNSGASVARGEILAFLDDDTRATPAWLEQMAPHLTDPRVLGAGGKLEPEWLDGRPSWFPDEFNWVVGGSYRGMPEQVSAVRNVWSANMAMRRRTFEALGGFRSGFGKVGACSRPEDTDLCIRALQRWPGGVWLYEPRAVVFHRVPSDRTSWHYFISRCYNEGAGKAQLSRMVGAAHSLSAEGRYTYRTLPLAVARNLGDALWRRDPAGLGRAGAIVAGLTVAAAGYASGLIRTGLT